LEDNGCQVRRLVVIPETTPLALLTDVRIDRVGAASVVLGADDTAVRWTVVDANGVVGTEQVFPLPAGTIRSLFAPAGVNDPGDTVVIGLLAPAPNGSDTELRFVAAPADGSPATPPGPPVVTFAGGVTTPPLVAMGASASGMNAGAAWLDPVSGSPTYALLDGQGQVVGAPAVIESEAASGYNCLGFASGKQELTITYQRGSVDPRLGPSWLIADVEAGGGVATLSLNVTQPAGTMSCARTVLYDPTVAGASPEYAIVWQDPSGSWLSVYYGPETGMVKSFPFASSADFGGPDLQPPIVGLATFGNDFGVLFARPHAVELWRTDRGGNRRSGSLPLPSIQGDVAGVASVSSPGLLTSTYADLTGAGEGRRVVVDAVCY
jgi:hypothetical protein